MRLLVFLHRWLGIVTCLLFLDWFASGIVMMYVQMPGLSEQDRLAALPGLDAARCQLSAREAIARAARIGSAAPEITLHDWATESIRQSSFEAEPSGVPSS